MQSFVASVEGTILYQSPTQRFSRWIWVYQVPIIICTNKWIKAKDKGSTAKWIRENSVHVKVCDYLYKRTEPPSDHEDEDSDVELVATGTQTDTKLGTSEL